MRCAMALRSKRGSNKPRALHQDQSAEAILSWLFQTRAPSLLPRGVVTSGLGTTCGVWVGCGHRKRNTCDERSHLTQIRDNLIGRIAEAESRRWIGEAEGLKVSRGQHRRPHQARRNGPNHRFSEAAGRTVATTMSRPTTEEPLTLHRERLHQATIQRSFTSSKKMCAMPDIWPGCCTWVRSWPWRSRPRRPEAGTGSDVRAAAGVASPVSSPAVHPPLSPDPPSLL